ncbi:MAG: catalase-related domain-containing protein, partial [Bacteroidales bacterium]
LFRLMPEDEKIRTISNISDALEGVPEFIRLRTIARFYLADPRCGLGVANKLSILEADIKQEAERLLADDKRRAE